MKKFHASFITICICLVFLFSTASVFAEEKSSVQSIKIFVDGEDLKSGSGVLNTNGFVYLPLRSVFEQLGAKIGWNNKTKAVTITKGDIEASVKIGERFAVINGEEIKLTTPAILYKGSTMLPFRFVSQCLDFKAEYNGQAGSINISTKTENENETKTEAALEQPVQNTKFEIANVSAKSELTVEVTFSHNVDKASAEEPGNYIISMHGKSESALPITKTEVDPSGSKVLITTSEPQRVATIYDVVISNVKDLQGNLTENNRKAFASLGKGLRLATITATSIEIVFDENLDKASAENIDNYLIYLKSDESQTLQITKAELDTTGKIVKVTFSTPGLYEKIYNITAQRILTADGKEIPKRVGGFGGMGVKS